MTQADAGSAEDPAERFHRAFVRDLASRLADRNGRLSLPLPASHTDEISAASLEVDELCSTAEVIPLASPDDWTGLSRRFVGGQQTMNLKPWFRTLGVLRGQKAVVAIIEPYYVCLDYRSEFATFYAHLHRQRSNSTLRIHFFSVPIEKESIHHLTEEQADSYLGYIICRPGDLPLVGRSVIQVPDYIEISTAINEPVNFYGQTLSVIGVPFMQQDARFAVCADIVAWVLHYSAFRRDIFERKLIADFAHVHNSIGPMKSRVPEGLTAAEAAALLDSVGFRSRTYGTPIALGPTVLPPATDSDLPELAAMIDGGVTDLAVAVTDLYNLARELDRYRLAQELDEADRDDDTADLDPLDTAEQLSPDSAIEDRPLWITAMDMLLDYHLRMQINSGFPAYGGTIDHAMAIVGRSPNEGRPIYYFHDDQIGPYLASDSLSDISRDMLRFQAGKYQDRLGTIRQDEPPLDRVRSDPSSFDRDYWAEGAERSLIALIFPLPSRVHLSPAAARADALSLLEDLQVSGLLDLVPNEDLTIDAVLVRGTEYKRERHKAAWGNDDAAVLAYSNVQLAEWVAVVEGIDSNGQAVFEFVYDASSNDDCPLLDQARYGSSLFTAEPTSLGPALARQVRLTMSRFPRYTRSHGE